MKNQRSEELTIHATISAEEMLQWFEGGRAVLQAKKSPHGTMVLRDCAIEWNKNEKGELSFTLWTDTSRPLFETIPVNTLYTVPGTVDKVFRKVSPLMYVNETNNKNTFNHVVECGEDKGWGGYTHPKTSCMLV